ncbi:hypothetical protein DU80_01015 [Methanosarcina mazei]|jgi:hypothetical protein|uniref:Uncharacterized protein n=2 Tax=Methanosarcina mazei TaxID=2209 RepID=A0A0F8G785_METMZ|nr:hypothetical protein MmTuc01_1708 [Methanosarcina mazei Tuc01]KKF99794.1 hypothetical protein DU31_18840 [Methanosarcina mazei]KKG02875.1 hypothetical protein DU40_19305 [Methanosarcina mazei]KKG06583.1 hypothetical protein DU47_16770 [Methanosarcina mazei]KKG19461.1 hypothetical protein DU34_16015 [Methanosarcina mazei]
MVLRLNIQYYTKKFKILKKSRYRKSKKSDTPLKICPKSPSDYPAITRANNPVFGQPNKQN